MPPIQTMPMRVRQRDLSRWRPYGSPTSLSLNLPNESESSFRPHPSPQKSYRHRHIKHNVSRPLHFQDSTRPLAPRLSPSSPPPSHSMEYAICPGAVLQSEPCMPSVSASPTASSLVDYVSTTCQRPALTREEDLPPLPEIRTDKPMLACANTPSAKELVGP